MNGRPQALLLDVEGVLVDYRVALAGALNTVREARRRGLAIRLVTNTATRHHEQLLQELLTLGFAVVAEELFTAPLAAQSWLQRRGAAAAGLGAPGDRTTLPGAGGRGGGRAERWTAELRAAG